MVYRKMMMDKKGKYTFSKDFIGNIPEGRPNLGSMMSLELYRLMQYTFRDAIERKYGTEASDRITCDAGYISGLALYDHIVMKSVTFQEFLENLKNVMGEMGIGIMNIEKADYDAGEFVITLSEDLDCSGLPNTGTTVCFYDVGFISAVIEKNTGKRVQVTETDCWASGSDNCRFTISFLDEEEK